MFLWSRIKTHTHTLQNCSSWIQLGLNSWNTKKKTFVWYSKMSEKQQDNFPPPKTNQISFNNISIKPVNHHHNVFYRSSAQHGSSQWRVQSSDKGWQVYTTYIHQWMFCRELTTFLTTISIQHLLDPTPHDIQINYTFSLSTIQSFQASFVETLRLIPPTNTICTSYLPPSNLTLLPFLWRR